MSDIEDIKQLDPEERVKRLKEVEAERKREIEEAETLIRDSMREISEAAEKKHVPIQQVTADDISQLATAEEKRIFKTARFQGDKPDSDSGGETQEPNLEEVTDEEALKTGKQPSSKPIYGIGKTKGISYENKTTTTGAKEESGNLYKSEDANVEKIYSSNSVTGESQEPQHTYQKGAVEERTSGMYAKKEDKKRVETY